VTPQPPPPVSRIEHNGDGRTARQTEGRRRQVAVEETVDG
jgi:hypothetical protein